MKEMSAFEQAEQFLEKYRDTYSFEFILKVYKRSTTCGFKPFDGGITREWAFWSYTSEEETIQQTIEGALEKAERLIENYEKTGSIFG